MSDYGVLSRTLHRLALGVPAVSEASFDIERGLHGKTLSSSEMGRHVFIAGLARSGTTVLMRSLYETGEFCSLTYRDMPFVLAPNTWSSLSAPGAKHKDAAARAHGDGVLVNFDSPEALEEVFWRVFCGERYIKDDRLCAMQVDTEDIQRFRTYVELILKRYDVERYLSKNNNNILRLAAIKSSFPEALTLVPYRAPEKQAYSLLKQHMRFRLMHEKDPFSARYMSWLVHHEFGADHRPFEWGLELSGGRDTTTIDYWLAQWIGVYSYLLDEFCHLADVFFPVGYELLCTETKAVWASLTDRIGIARAPPPTLNLQESELPPIADQPLLTRARDLFEALQAETCRRI